MIEEKTRLLDEASAHRWVLVLGHETEQPAGYVDAEGEWTAETALSPCGPSFQNVAAPRGQHRERHKDGAIDRDHRQSVGDADRGARRG